MSHLRPAVVLLVLFTALTGFAYPLAVTGIAKLVFAHQANGSLVETNGKVIGSELIGQNFTSDRYFHGRPSAISGPDPSDASKTAAAPYDASNSMGSNAGPTAKTLIDRVKGDVDALKKENPGEPVPVDLVTSSGSGLDPHISPAAVQFQEKRVAKARGIGESELRALIGKHTQPRFLGLFGEPVVNVLQLNIDLDAAQKR